MLTLFTLLSLCAPTAAAQSFSKPMVGLQLDAGLSGGLQTPGPGLSGGGRGSFGIWWGPYDDSYAIGRFNAVVVDQRFEPAGQNNRTSTLGYRRGIDLLVIKGWGEVAAGAERSAAGVVPVVRAGGGVKYRFKPYLGVVARLDAGVALPESVPSLRTSMMLGLEWSKPVRRSSDED